MNRPNHSTPTVERSESAVLVPRADAWESSDAYHFDVELPGVDPQAISIEFERRVLTIAAETTPTPTPPANEAGGADTLELAHREFVVGAFRRSFRLPEDVDGDAIEARSEHGVLTLRVPKQRQAARKITVRTN